MYSYVFRRQISRDHVVEAARPALLLQEREDATRRRGRVVRSCHIERLTVTAILKVTGHVLIFL